jgi:hypothetical protein
MGCALELVKTFAWFLSADSASVFSSILEASEEGDRGAVEGD